MCVMCVCMHVCVLCVLCVCVWEGGGAGVGAKHSY